MRSLLLIRFSIVLLAGLLASCGEPDDTPYLKHLGGGFIFNYRVGDAFYGIVVKAERRLPDGSVIEAEFENPAGAKPFVLQQAASAGRSEYSFRTPPLRGVKKDTPYRVTVRLRKSATGPVFTQFSHSYRSSLDQAALPKLTPSKHACGPEDRGKNGYCVTGR